MACMVQYTVGERPCGKRPPWCSAGANMLRIICGYWVDVFWIVKVRIHSSASLLSLAIQLRQAIVVINASKDYVREYYVNCGEQCGAWECIAEALAWKRVEIGSWNRVMDDCSNYGNYATISGGFTSLTSIQLPSILVFTGLYKLYKYEDLLPAPKLRICMNNMQESIWLWQFQADIWAAGAGKIFWPWLALECLWNMYLELFGRISTRAYCIQ